MPPVYLDDNATTPVDPRVFEAMRRYSLDDFGNAGSRTHRFGQEAKKAVDKAREQIAHLVHARPEEVIFTSDATESNNAVLLGLATHGRKVGRTHVLVSAIEHASVLEPARELASDGFDVELVPVTRDGYVQPDAIRSRLRPNTLIVSLMHANNETGLRQPILGIASLLAEGGVLFHVDAAQTFGKEVEELRALECDFLSLSGHKILGPKGVGALRVRSRAGKRSRLTPRLFGGGQEMGLRPGTLAVPLIVGLGLAADLAAREHASRQAAALAIRQDFLDALSAVDHDVNGDLDRIQPNVLNVSFPGVESEALMLALRDAIAF
jgi:cysteine desulfurase